MPFKGTYDGVAVVGMACRTAGNVNSPQQLWELLLAQKDGVSEVPASRWKPYYTRNPRNKAILDNATKRGYFVENIEDFDCQFFGISPKEAEQMDPQQRLSLEIAIEALQDAGIPARSLKGTDTSVFWGVNSDDYSKLVLEDLGSIDAWMGIGTAYCGVPNRISYHLDLKGPSAAVDAACASSLVAVHNGVSAILNGESSISIVGGVNALYGPGLTIVLQRAGALASDGRCRSFDDGAKGYGRGEGAGAVILKNHAEAVRDGDHILGVIQGTAVAHDGKKNGIMAPNAAAQSLVADNALRVANLEPSAIQYIEAHATSTPLGDPTEVSAMSAVYGGRRDAPCHIGSIKPNIGHLEAGAGVMGLIKALLAVQKGVLPPQTNLNTLNSRIDWEESGLKVVQKEKAWPECDGPRRAAICSYGYGGTVSHAILEQYQEFQTHDQGIRGPDIKVLMISAPQKKRLPIIAKSLRTWIAANGTEENLASICTTLATRRDHHESRFSAVIKSIPEALGSLDSLSKGGNPGKWACENRCMPTNLSKEVVWVFSGHGAQWTDMGKEMLSNSVFCNAINPLDEIIQSEINSSPIEWLRNGDFEPTDRIQILTYIMQIGIAAVLESNGLLPNAIVGHSVGEIAASVVAGALSPVEGALVVTRRAVLYRQVMGQGAMALVNKSSTDVSQDLKGRSDLTVAISSSPSSCVIAGPKDEVALLADTYREQGIKASFVKTDVAFHSPMMGPLGKPLVASIKDTLHPKRPCVKLYSTSLSDSRDQALRDAEYWTNNMISPVRLTETITCAIEDGYRVFLEVSSHPIVSHSITETVMETGVEDFSVVSTMRRDDPADTSILHALGQLHCAGVDVDWRMQMPGPWAQGLPTETWHHQTLLPKLSSSPGAIETHIPIQHTLVGHHIPVAGTDTVVYSTFLEKESKPFPGDHPVSGTEIIPAACLLNTFLQATRSTRLEQVHLKVPVAVDVARSVQVVVQGREVKIMSQLSNMDNEAGHDASWLTHTTACCSGSSTSTPYEKVDLSCSAMKRQVDGFTIDYLARVGVSAMGFPWRVLEHYGDSQEMLARVDVAPGVEIPDWDASSWAPFLDAATSIGSCIFYDEERLRMPSKIQQLEIVTECNPPKLGWVHVHRDPGPEYRADVRVLDEQGVVLAILTGMQFSEIEGISDSNTSVGSLVHSLAWPPALPAEKPFKIDQVVMVGRDQSLMQEHASSLPAHVHSLQLSECHELESLPGDALGEGTVIAYIPPRISSLRDVIEEVERQSSELLEIIKYAVHSGLPLKVFVLTTNAIKGHCPTALANAPLVGLSRVIASEHPEHFGGLIDGEDCSVSLTTMKYIQGADVIHIQDGVPRTGRLRSLPLEARTQEVSRCLPRPEGTYLITGGLGDLGLATAEFLVENGARRLVLLSRRSLPPRSTWNQPHEGYKQVIAKIQGLERLGVSVHTLAIDIGARDAATKLQGWLDKLGLPPVLGVVHAAGIVENELVLNSTKAAFHRVFAPKINGALALHEAFPPGSLDFLVMYSSCGQLLGFQGQASYGSANAFLDTLATYRRSLGDNAISFQWTSWRGMGLGSDSDFVAAELEGKGVTDITRHEAFQAWMHLAQFDMDHGVVLRTRTLRPDEPVPCPVIRDIVTRSAPDRNIDGQAASKDGAETPTTIPTSGPELKAYLDEHIRSCVAEVLQTTASDVDSRAAMSDYGLDSVMSVVLRRKLQQSLNVSVPPNFTWNHPTVRHLVEWFSQKLGGNA